MTQTLDVHTFRHSSLGGTTVPLCSECGLSREGMPHRLAELLEMASADATCFRHHEVQQRAKELLARINAKQKATGIYQ